LHFGFWHSTSTYPESSLNILERGLSRQRLPFEPVEIEPLLAEIPASTIVEAGSPQPFRGVVH